MSDSFWFLTGEDDPQRETPVSYDHAPFQQSMRGDRGSRPMSAPSTDQKRVRRRQIHRSGTVLNTQIERLSKGDMIRTPTGQSAQVKGIRPHETDATKMYLDTEMGTSVVQKGTDFQVVPRNSQQQELPDIGNPMGSGNSGQVPAGGHGPGGPGANPAGQNANVAMACPNCGNSNTLRMHGGNYICSVCGYSIAAGGSPGNLLFTDQSHGYAQPRRQPGTVPKAHVWAARYTSTEDQMARRIRQVLGGEK